MKNYKHVFERVMALAGSNSDELKALLWLLFLRRRRVSRRGPCAARPKSLYLLNGNPNTTLNNR